ncbi:cell wall metabolism sensor histidine kinase WalK [Pedobacter sp. SYP-B3415]|uniref:sensor histidine kinase n=1 Tax=Pedobacter sp. SYP-B3415 TaxID=2496641 RepID=UPI00101BDB4A|nr:HAMP domain-containing sensor histidine kinase [Pedobacter sp. SYP-B3415]
MTADQSSRLKEVAAATDPEERLQLAMHELKTPLTVIKAYLQLMSVRAEKEQLTEIQAMIHKTEEQVRKVVDIIYATQEIKPAETADLDCVLIPFDLSEAAQSCAEAIASTRPGRRIELDIESGKHIVNGDKDRLEQVFLNLINNAIKYTDDSCVIRIGLKRVDNAIMATISDNGQGIPQEFQYRLFDRHYRLDGSAKKAEGRGLGLFVCAEIIRRHDGQIGVDSNPGEGASFWFILPMGKRI